MSHVSETLEAELKAELETRLQTPEEGAFGGFIDMIMPILVQLLQQILAGCGNTPATAARRLKRLGPWTRNNIYTGISRKQEFDDIATQAYESVIAVIQKNDETTFEAMITEEKDERVDWSLF